MVYGGLCYLQIVGFLEQVIVDECFKFGDCLLLQWMLVDCFGVDFIIVICVYGEVCCCQLLEGCGVVGSFVVVFKVDLSQVIDLLMNILLLLVGIDLDDLLCQGVLQVLMYSDVDLLMMYYLGGGSSVDCVVGVMWLQDMLGLVEDDWVLVCLGVQLVLVVLLLLQIWLGEIVLVELLVYFGLLVVVVQFGWCVVVVGVDYEGMCLDLFMIMVCKYGVWLVYFNLMLQNLIICIMLVVCCVEIVLVVIWFDLCIIEDDFYWCFVVYVFRLLVYYVLWYVFYVFMLVKCLFFGLWIVYVFILEGQVQDEVLVVLWFFVLMFMLLIMVLLMQWIYDGIVVMLVEGICQEVWVCQVLVLCILGEEGLVDSGGIYFWKVLLEYWKGQDFVCKVREVGFNVVVQDSFQVGDGEFVCSGVLYICFLLGCLCSCFELVYVLWWLMELVYCCSLCEIVVQGV